MNMIKKRFFFLSLTPEIYICCGGASDNDIIQSREEKKNSI